MSRRPYTPPIGSPPAAAPPSLLPSKLVRADFYIPVSSLEMDCACAKPKKDKNKKCECRLILVSNVMVMVIWHFFLSHVVSSYKVRLIKTKLKLRRKKKELQPESLFYLRCKLQF